MNRTPTIQPEIATQQRVIAARRRTAVRLDTELEARREKVRLVGEVAGKRCAGRV